jgi:hypothetical protein
MCAVEKGSIGARLCPREAEAELAGICPAVRRRLTVRLGEHTDEPPFQAAVNWA